MIIYILITTKLVFNFEKLDSISNLQQFYEKHRSKNFVEVFSKKKKQICKTNIS